MRPRGRRRQGDGLVRLRDLLRDRDAAERLVLAHRRSRFLGYIAPVNGGTGGSGRCVISGGGCCGGANPGGTPCGGNCGGGAISGGYIAPVSGGTPAASASCCACRSRRASHAGNLLAHAHVMYPLGTGHG